MNAAGNERNKSNDNYIDNDSINEAAEPCGAVIVNKPAGMTSFDVVAKLRNIYGTRRIGHTGTLDPDATGVLILLIGRAAKAAEYITAGKKAYHAKLCLGIETTTQDLSGEILRRNNKGEGEWEPPTYKDVCDAAAYYTGEYMQTPPMYSALKRDGKKLVDLARRGINVEREPRAVYVYGISVTSTEKKDEFLLDVVCSSGTYIRTLCADIGERLGCGGAMGALCRTETGGFSLSLSHTIEEISQAPMKYLISVGELFSGYDEVFLSGDDKRRVENGLDAKTAHENGRVALYRTADDEAAGKEFFGIGMIEDGRVRCERRIII